MDYFILLILTSDLLLPVSPLRHAMPFSWEGNRVRSEWLNNVSHCSLATLESVKPLEALLPFHFSKPFHSSAQESWCKWWLSVRL